MKAILSELSKTYNSCIFITKKFCIKSRLSWLWKSGISFMSFTIILSVYGFTINNDSLLIENYRLKSNHYLDTGEHLDSAMLYLDLMGTSAFHNGFGEPYIYSLLVRFNIAMEFEAFELSECFIKECYNEIDTFLPVDHEYHYYILNNSADYYSNIGKSKLAFSLAVQALNKLKLSKLNRQRYLNEIIITYNLGPYVFETGDSQKGISYLNKTMNLIADSIEKVPSLITKICQVHYTLGLFNFNIGKFNSAVTSYKKNLEAIKQNNTTRTFELIRTHISLADALSQLGKSQEGLKSLEIALQEIDKYEKKNKTRIREANYFNVKAKCLASLGRFEESYQNSELGLAVSRKRFASVKKAPLTGNLLISYANSYTLQKEWVKSLKKYQEALIQFVPNFDQTDIYSLPEEEKVENIGRSILNILKEKAIVFHHLYKESGEIRDLKAAWEATQLFVTLMDEYRKQKLSTEAQLYISTNYKTVFELSIKYSVRLYELEGDNFFLHTAFDNSEKSKAVSLHRSLNDIQAKYSASLPDSLLKKEDDLHSKISFYKKTIFKEENKLKDADESKLRNWKSILFQLELDKDTWVEEIEKSYPEYYAYKYETENLTLPLLKAKLSKDNAVLLSYFTGQKSIYIFVLSKDGLAYRIIDKAEALYEQLDTFIPYLHQVSQDSIDHDEFKRISQYLYTELIGNKLKTHKKVIIIPDGKIGLLPFELLSSNKKTKGKKSSNTYLLYDKEIQYAYSAKLLFNDPLNREKRKKAKKTWLGIAPEFSGSKKLVFNTTETKAIQDMLNGDILEGVKASKAAYLSQAEDYSIIHLATHGYPNQESPQFARLEFSKEDSLENGILYAHEIMNQRLNVDLVVLSACETGYGPIVEGEGIMSIARSYRYAGSPSIIMSLWQAESSVSERIMISFYKYLKAGKSKDQALRLAKIDYLKNPIPGREHPRYWANFVLIGDASPIIQKWDSIYTSFLLGVILVLLLTFYFWKFKKG